MPGKTHDQVMDEAKAAIDANHADVVRSRLREEISYTVDVTEEVEVLKNPSTVYGSPEDYEAAEKETKEVNISIPITEPVLNENDFYELIIYARQKGRDNIADKIFAWIGFYDEKDNPITKLNIVYQGYNKSEVLKLMGLAKIEKLAQDVLDNQQLNSKHVSMLEAILNKANKQYGDKVNPKILNDLQDRKHQVQLKEEKIQALKRLINSANAVLEEIARLKDVLQSAKEAHEQKLGTKLVNLTSLVGLFKQQREQAAQRTQVVDEALQNLQKLSIKLRTMLKAAMAVNFDNYKHTNEYETALKAQCKPLPILQQAVTTLINASLKIQNDVDQSDVAHKSTTKDAIDVELNNLAIKHKQPNDLYHQIDVEALRNENLSKSRRP